MRLNENALNLPAYAVEFRVFCIATALTLRAYGAYYRFDLLFSRSSFMAIMLNSYLKCAFCAFSLGKKLFTSRIPSDTIV